MIEVRISVEEDIYDKNLKSTTTIGTEETFVLPEGYTAVDKFTLIRGVRDFLKKAIAQHGKDTLSEDLEV